MIRTVLSAALVSVSFVSAAVADEANKQAECKFQGDLIGAVQQARLDRVNKDKLTDTVMAAHPSWPASAADAIPAIGEYVYSFKRRDLRKVDLGVSTQQQCLENWEQIQELKKSMSN